MFPIGCLRVEPASRKEVRILIIGMKVEWNPVSRYYNIKQSPGDDLPFIVVEAGKSNTLKRIL
jgi:hypothetical protein